MKLNSRTSTEGSPVSSVNVTAISHLYSLRDFWGNCGLCRAAVHSGWGFLAPCTNILTYLLTKLWQAITLRNRGTWVLMSVGCQTRDGCRQCTTSRSPLRRLCCDQAGMAERNSAHTVWMSDVVRTKPNASETASETVAVDNAKTNSTRPLK